MEDGDELPTPSSIQWARHKFAANIGPDDALVFVPLVKSIGKAVRINISVDAALLKAIDDEAQKRGLTRSAFLVAAALEQVA